jgi:hypothetical protein
MFTIDIAKALHPRTFGYFAPLMPGFFFEVSVLLSSPSGLRNFSGRAQLGYYTILVVALIVAFIIGVGFMLFVRLIQLGMGQLCRLVRFLKREIAESLQPVVGGLMAKPQLSFRRRRWQSHFGKVLMQWIHPEEINTQGVWHDAAKKLLEECYGITAQPQDWSVWYEVLGKPAPEHFRGSLMVVASEAVGWSGLVAARLSPVLRNRYYVGFCALLVFYGLLADWAIASRLQDPVMSAFIRINGVLRELKEVRMHKVGSDETQSEDDPQKS